MDAPNLPIRSELPGWNLFWVRLEAVPEPEAVGQELQALLAEAPVANIETLEVSAA
jgi:hypothetical protein